VKRKAASTHNYLKAARSPHWQGDLLVLTYPRDDFAAARIMESSHRRLVENTVSLIYRRSVRIKLTFVEPEGKYPAPDDHGGGEHHHAAGPESGDTVMEAEDSYEFGDVLKLFPGQVFDVQLKED
jgi:hypothetical protein